MCWHRWRPFHRLLISVACTTWAIGGHTDAIPYSDYEQASRQLQALLQVRQQRTRSRVSKAEQTVPRGRHQAAQADLLAQKHMANSTPYNRREVQSLLMLLNLSFNETEIRRDVERTLDTHRHTMWVAIWVLSPVYLFFLVWYIKGLEGWNLVQKIVPVATAVSLCIVVSRVTNHLGEPWSHFSAMTALITVVFVMDMGTFERFCIKITLRSLGTVIGGILAMIAGEFSELTKHHMMVPTGFVFFIFVGDCILAKNYGYMAYTFTMTSVTFSLVFYGYVRRGWVAAWDRFLSVFTGEGLAIISTVFFSLLFFRVVSSLSTVTIIVKAQEIFAKTLVALDFAFIRNHIHSAPDDASCLEAQNFDYQEEVRQWFRLDKEPSASELRALAKSTIFHDLPMDVSVAALQTECRAFWSDMIFLRNLLNLAPTKIFGYEFRQKTSPPNFCSLPERAHPLFVQASALAHASLIEPCVWSSLGPKLEAVRVQLQWMQKPFEQIFGYKINSIKSGRPVMDKHREDVLQVMTEVAGGLQKALDSLDVVRSELLTNPDEVPAGSLARFDGFCHGLGLVIADFSSLAMTCLQLTDCKENEGETRVKKIIDVLSECAGLDPQDLLARNQMMDISSDRLLKHWERVQALIPKHGSAPIDEGEGE